MTCEIVSCSPGYDDRDPLIGGCETSTASDPMSCGACGFLCPNPPMRWRRATRARALRQLRRPHERRMRALAPHTDGLRRMRCAVRFAGRDRVLLDGHMPARHVRSGLLQLRSSDEQRLRRRQQPRLRRAALPGLRRRELRRADRRRRRRRSGAQAGGPALCKGAFCTSQTAVDLNNEAKALALGSTAVFVVAGALVATGAGMIIYPSVSGPPAPQTAHLKPTLGVGLGVGSLAVHGRF